MHKRYSASRYISSILEALIRSTDDFNTDKDENVKRWLYLLSAATGSGKSHSIASVMGKIVSEKNQKHKKRFIYVVHTIDNLRDIHEKLLQKTPSIKDQVLMLKKESEMILDFFEREQKGDIDAGNIHFLEEFETYRALRGFMLRIFFPVDRGLKRDKMKILNEENDRINTYLRALKKELRKHYRRIDKNDQAAREKFRKDVSVIFPTANLKQYRIIFTTTHRFMRSVWRLESAEKLYDMTLFKNQFLVIDEIDAQKKTMLGIIAEESAQMTMDEISLFEYLNHVLHRVGLRVLAKYGISEEAAESIVTYFEETYQKYYADLAFLYKNDEEDSDSPRYIVKSAISSIVKNNMDNLVIERKASKHLNYVLKQTYKPDSDPLYFSNLVRDIEWGLRRIIALGSAIVIQAKAEARDKNEEADIKRDAEEVGRKKLEDFLRDLELSPEDDPKKFRYLEEAIKHEKRLTRKERKRHIKTYGESFYPEGFSVVEIISPENDDGYERLRSGFRFHRMRETPEYIFQAVSSRMFTIGISATATLETVTQNLDLGYLRSVLPVKTLTPLEIEKLNKMYIDDNRQQEREFDVKFTDEEDMGIEDICKAFYNNDKSIIPRLRDFENKYTEKGKRKKKTYQYDRYKKYLRLYWEFITNRKITSMLAFVNALPKETRLDDLKHLFSQMLLCNRNNPMLKSEARALIDYKRGTLVSGAEERLFFVVDAESMKSKHYKTKIENAILSKDGSAFIFTTYKTMGSGKNIDYAVAPRGLIHRCVLRHRKVIFKRFVANAEKLFRKRDFSAIYCEQPTHIIPRSDSEEDTNQPMLELLYYVHALNVSNATSNEEFRRSLTAAIKRNFKRVAYGKNTEDYINAVMSIVIQAVGRCHRVNNPEDPLTIFIDESLYGVVSNFDASKITLLPSVKKLLEVASNSSQSPKEKSNDILTRQIAKNSNRLNRITRNMLKYIREDQRTAQEYSELRMFFLKNPSVSSLNQNVFSLGYTPKLPLKRYWYKTDNDYTSTIVGMKKGGEDWVEVSEEAANLHLIRNMPRLKQYFEEHDIPLRFEHKHLLTPAAFNNLYKGILGETIGQYILQHECHTRLLELDYSDGYFEFFDFETPNGFYIDFKYFSSSTLSSTKESDIRAKAVPKLREMNARAGMVINIFYHGTEKSGVSREITYEDGIYIVPFLIDATDPQNPYIDKTITRKIMEILNEYD